MIRSSKSAVVQRLQFKLTSLQGENWKITNEINQLKRTARSDSLRIQKAHQQQLQSEVVRLRKAVSYLMAGNSELSNQFKIVGKTKKQKRFFTDQTIQRFRKQTLTLMHQNTQLKKKLTQLNSKLERLTAKNKQLQSQLIQSYLQVKQPTESNFEIHPRLHPISRDIGCQTIETDSEKDLANTNSNDSSPINSLVRRSSRGSTTTSFLKFKMLQHDITQTVREVIVAIRYQCAYFGISIDQLVNIFKMVNSRTVFQQKIKENFDNLSQEQIDAFTDSMFVGSDSSGHLAQKLKILVGSIIRFEPDEIERFEWVRDRVVQRLERHTKMIEQVQINDLHYLFPEIKKRDRQHLRLVFYLNGKKSLLELAQCYRRFEYTAAM